jgi:predicted nucleic-acid-binding Zn-ribbon protein
MASSTCIKCGGHTFEIKLNEPRDAKYKFYFIQCAGCGGVVGTHEYYHIGNIVKALGKKLGVSV